MSATCLLQGGIVLNVASSGIATLLLEGGRTAHLQFSIPINVVEDSMCNIVADSELVFGGKVLMFGRDFQQMMPVVANGNRQDVVHAAINTSYLWKHFTVMMLMVNIRLGSSSNSSKRKEIQDFANWMLNIRNDKIGGKNDGEAIVEFSDDMLIPDSDDHIGSIIQETCLNC
ncbi:ATP-dependent DNA helicase PIF1-like protein [Tanacetum coccineum]